MDGRHPSDQNASNLLGQDANNLLGARNVETDLQPEDFEDPPEGGDFPNDGWQQQRPGNDDSSSESDIDDDLIQEGKGEGDVLADSRGNEQNAPPTSVQDALFQLWSFQNSENRPVDLDRLGITAPQPTGLQHLGETINVVRDAAAAAAAAGSSNTSTPLAASSRIPPVVVINLPTGPGGMWNSPVAGFNPPAGPSRTPFPAAFANPPPSISNTSNPPTAGVHPLARPVAAAAGAAGYSNPSSSPLLSSNPIVGVIAAAVGVAGASGSGNTPSPPGTGATTPTGCTTSRFASVWANPQASSSNTSSLPASGITAPNGRATSRYAEIFTNPPARPTSTPISSRYLNQPRTGFLSNSPSDSSTPPQPPTGTSPARPSITSNPTAAAHNTDRLETEIRGMGDRLTTLEQSITRLTTSYQSDQAVLLPALAEFTRATTDQQAFTRAILTGQEVRQRWQGHVDISLREIAGERQRSNDNFDRILHDQTGVMAHLRHWDRVHDLHQENLEVLSRAQQHIEGDLHNIHVHLQRFVGTWDANRAVVEENQRLILSQVSWLEPVAIFSQFLGWFLRLFMFWQWGRGVRDGPPHRWPPGGPAPPGGPGGGDNGGGGGGDDGDGDGFGGHGGQQAGNQGGGQGGQQAWNQQAGNQQGVQQAGGQVGGEGGQQAAGNQAAAQLAPGQIGSNLRVDGIPYQPYRPPGAPDYEPLVPLFSQGQDTERAERQARHRQVIIDGITSFLLIIMLLATAVNYLYPALWAFYVPYVAVPTFTRHPGASAEYTRAAAPARGAWLDEPVMKALFAAQKEAQTVATLAAQSAESVVACAKLVEDGNSITTQLKQDEYGKSTKDTDGTCTNAVRLGAEAAERMKALAGRLEWAFGEKWWATLTSTERSPWKTAMGEVESIAKVTTGKHVVDRTAIVTIMATETETARWQWPKRRFEQERLDLQHHLYKLTLDGKLNLTPVSNPQFVLGIGTGTGIWAVEYALQNPSAKVIGTDLSAIQPQFVPPNCQFEVDDAEDEWVYEEKFDYIHGRALFSAFKDPSAVFRKAYDALAPGGWFEMQEVYFKPQSIDGTVEGTALQRWNSTLIEGAKKIGRDWLCTPNYEKWFKEAGFEDVVERQYQWPSNTWPRGKKNKTLGL